MTDFWQDALSKMSDEERFKDYPEEARLKNYKLAKEQTFYSYKKLMEYWKQGNKMQAFFGAVVTASDGLDGFKADVSQCKNNCSSCCYQHLPAMQPECFLIGMILEDHGQIDQYKEKVLSAAKKIEGISHSVRYERKIGCPFLVKKSCGIYEDRPLVCRAHHSANRSRCLKAFKYPHKVEHIGIPYWAEPKEYLNGPTMAIGAFCEEVGLPSQHVEFERAMAILFQQESIRGAWERWLGGEPVLKDAEVGEAEGAHQAYKIIRKVCRDET